jgi:Velvet factor
MVSSQPETGDHRRTGMLLNKGPSKVLATAMSETFQVFSAKKFPGMIESTELSKAFAHQGIRIAVRHNTDANNANGSGSSNQNRRNTGSGSPLGKISDGEDDAEEDGDEE